MHTHTPHPSSFMSNCALMNNKPSYSADPLQAPFVLLYGNATCWDWWGENWGRLSESLRPARSHPAQVSFSQAPCSSPSSSVFLRSLLLKVGTSNPLLNLLNGAKPIYQLTHFRWIIYPFILSDNAADVTRGAEAGFFFGGISYFLLFFTGSHVSLIKLDAAILYCCATAEKIAIMLFMLRGTCENSNDLCGNFLSHELQICHHNGIQSWRSGNDPFLDLRRMDGRNVKLHREFKAVQH